jgi:3-oxoacyl-[acyl-carrier-protein] synthase-3
MNPITTESMVATPSMNGELKTIFSKRTCHLTGVQIIGTGGYVPENVVNNEDLKRERGFDPDWIVQRTGILERRYVSPGQGTSDLCIPAAKIAMEQAGLTPQDIDLIVVGTFTPDYHCPSVANLVQDRLKIDAPSFDVAAACSGFMYAMTTAAQFIATKNAHYALVLGADCNSRIVDPNDNKIAPIFGDGAGAVILTQGDNEQGLLAYQMGSDGSGAVHLDRPAGGSKNPITAEAIARGEHYLRMDGKPVFKWAVRAVEETIRLVIDASELNQDQIHKYFFHQANMRIVSAVAESMNLPLDRFENNIQRYGNTSAASIPLALHEAYTAGRIHRGDNLLMTGFGAGLTWGTGVFRW